MKMITMILLMGMLILLTSCTNRLDGVYFDTDRCPKKNGTYCETSRLPNGTVITNINSIPNGTFYYNASST